VEDDVTHQPPPQEKPVSSYRQQAAVRHYVNALELPWHKPQRKNLLWLTEAFLREQRLPIRRLARALSGPQLAQRYADRRLRRFLGNDRLDLEGALAALLRFLLPRLPTGPYVPLMLDWTTVGTTYAILWLQLPYRGRSFPLWAVVVPYTENNSTPHEIDLLTLVHRCWPKTAPPPLLLADRGFPKEELLRWLPEHGWQLVIRACRNVVLHDGQGRRVYPDAQPDAAPSLYPDLTWTGPQLTGVHLVASARRDPKAPAGKTTWLLLTNLPVADLPLAPGLYAHRMQPEQTHRDCKHGHFVSGFGLAHLKRLRKDRLQRLLFCLGLIYCFLILVAETEREERERLKRRHWGLSLITYALSLLETATRTGTVLALTKQALACVQLQPLWPKTGDS
jgi:hypothetical protein